MSPLQWAKRESAYLGSASDEPEAPANPGARPAGGIQRARPPQEHPPRAERGGTQLVAPKPVLLVDKQEKIPFDFAPYRSWFADIKRVSLRVGDYSVEGIEDCCAIERKGLDDIMKCLTVDRSRFLEQLRRLEAYDDSLLLIDASLSALLARREHGANPGRLMNALMAIMAGPRLKVMFGETTEIGAQIAARYLYITHLLNWAESNGFGRFVSDEEL